MSSEPVAMAATPCGPVAAGQSAIDVNRDLAQSVLRANVRQELVASATAIIELAEMLLKDARERGPEKLLADLLKIQDAGKNLLTLVDEILAAARGEVQAVDFEKLIRHDLRTQLNHVIGYNELWLDDAKEYLLEGFVPDLEGMRSVAKQMLLRVNQFLERTDNPGKPMDAWIANVARSLPGPLHREAPKGSILVVDDNDINCDILSRWLRRDGHAVAVARNGQEALQAVRSQPFDLVLLDIIMPQLNGFEVLEQLKADDQLRHIPVIMISAFDQTDSVVRCIEMGAEDYLPKPFSQVLLKARIGASLEKARLQKRSEELLHLILPAEIVKELKATNVVRPRRYENVAVLFCDVVGFTPFCDQNQPEAVVPHLQQLIETWEQIALRHEVEKIKTIGDAFMAAAGLLQPVTGHPVLHCIRCGQEMIASAQALPTHWNVRVGIHIGPVVAGVIGRRQFLFDLWGDTVNTASRMESHGVPGRITVSKTAWQHVAHCCRGESLGTVEVKGKGRMEMIRFDGFIS